MVPVSGVPSRTPSAIRTTALLHRVRHTCIKLLHLIRLHHIAGGVMLLAPSRFRDSE
jgi:hypothetical protein